jgi:hypothetical protein
MSAESRYYIAAIRKRRIIDKKVHERQEKIPQRTDEVRDKSHDEIRKRTNQTRTGRNMYEQEKRERLISGDKEKGPKAPHNARMREAETLFNLQSKQLSKLASCENRRLESIDEEERLTLEQRWVEIITPTEDIVAAIYRQLG